VGVARSSERARAIEKIGLGQMANSLCELKSGQFQLMRLAIYQHDASAIQSFVADQVSSAPTFFENAAVAIDASALPTPLSAAALEDLVTRLRYAGVQPIAMVTEVDTPTAELARSLRLGVVAPSKKGKAKLEHGLDAAPEPTIAPIAETKSSPAPVVAAPEKAIQRVIEKATEKNQTASVQSASSSTRDGAVDTENVAQSKFVGAQVYEGQIRSGQQYYARGRDLIVAGSVGAGAEVMADGNIHIYGRMLGKVIAGAAGDQSARIFVQAFGAELVSIAGIYRVFESISSDIRGKAVQIYLSNDKLKIEPLIA
jgi:septum site-determining protein MinC